MEPTENQGAHQPHTPPMAEDDPVVQWLLQGDPAIRWQVLRDLVNASETEVATERARVEHEGWGARLLAQRAPDGLWANGAYIPDTAAFAAATARALAAGEPPPPFPPPDADPAEAPTDGRMPSRAAVDRDVPGPARPVPPGHTPGQSGDARDRAPGDPQLPLGVRRAAVLRR